MPIRMTGMVSGLDTEALVSAMVSAYSMKKTKSEKSVQSLKWKQEAWSDLNKKVKSLYSSVNSLRFSSAYSLKKAVASDSTKATVSASSNAVSGTQKLVIKQLASSGYLTGAKLQEGTTSSTTLEDLGYTSGSGKISVTVGGKSTDIDVSGDTKISDFVTSLKEAGVNANFDEANGRLFISAKASGKDNDFTLTGNNAAGLAALNKFGVNAESKANKEMYASYAKYKDQSLDDIKSLLSGIESNKENITNKKSENASIQDSITYANNYQKAYDTIMQTNLSGDEKEELEKLLSQSSVNLYIGNDGNYYDKVEEEKNDDGEVTGYKYSRTYIDENGDEQKDSITVGVDEKLQTITERVQELAESDDSGLLTTEDEEGNRHGDSAKISALYTQLRNVREYQSNNEGSEFVASVKTGYTVGDSTNIDALVAEKNADIKANERSIKESEKYLSDNKVLDTGVYDDDAAQALYDKIQTYAGYMDADMGYNAGAFRVNGQDSIIELNDAEYTSTSNNFTINGLTINATGVTDDNGITITTDSDNQAIYDKVKSFLKQYNELVNEMNKNYNAASAKGYEPLSDEEKEAMTDKQVEDWEKKIKDAIFRRDDNLRSVLNAMTTSMAKSYKIGDKTFSLASLGISTKSYFEADDNDNYAYHIAGDKDDEYSSGKEDKLLAAINDNPDDVVDFLKQLTDGLYKSLDGKMKKTALSSSSTIYNDVQFSKQLKTYEKDVKKWEEKISAYEDKWYNTFAQMEKSMSKMQSQQSQLAGMMGM